MSDVERAGHFFITIRQSFSSLRTNWSAVGKFAKTQARPYRNAINRLPEVHERLRNVHIEHKDAIECIKQCASPKQRLEDVKVQVNSNYFDCFVILDIERTRESKQNFGL
ncbi:MAG: hypothetical protein FWG73_00900 [Planctomycetaceae bacterium]|nr:hypothetical protein [Planctomycetaceae bacterium]